MKLNKRLEVAAVLLILIVSLSLRLIRLDAFVAPDEMRWTCRSLQFRDALRRGDWANTFRVGHPGVLTTWLGTLFIPRDDAQALSTCHTTDDARRLLEAGATSEEQTRLLGELREMLFRGRVGTALFTWLCIIAIYFLARFLWGSGAALMGLMILALDPFYLALSRVLHVDAVLTSTMMLSALCLLASLRHPYRSVSNQLLLIGSGVAGGLAALQKTPGGFAAPFAALALAVHILREGLNREMLDRLMRDLILWGLTAGVIYIACWPAMWVEPEATLQKVLDKALGYAQEGHENDLYFMGRPVHDPGWGFYPVATLFRIMPPALIGLVGAIYRLTRKDISTERRIDLALLLLYSIFFGIFMSLGAKKFDRYLLPAFPALDIAGALGLLEIGRKLGSLGENRFPDFIARHRQVPLLVYLITFVIQLAVSLPGYPYYLTCYNPLLGGLPVAEKVLLVGWGEGYDQAAAYLNAKPDVQNMRAAAPSVSAFAPLFEGQAQNMVEYTVWETDYVVFYLSHVQRLRYEEVLEKYFLNPELQPEKVVTLRGVEYAWIYRNTYHIPPTNYIEEHAQPGRECLLANGDSVLARQYQEQQGQLPLYTFSPEWSSQEMGQFLDDLSPRCERLWYAHYPAAPFKFLDLLQSRGLMVEKETFPHVEVVLYEPVEPKTEPTRDEVYFEMLQLTGYGLTDPAPAWGRDGGMFLEWEAQQPLEENYTAFIHLYDAHGHRIAQTDQLITDRYLRPTSQWSAGRHSRIYHISIPPGTPPGRYRADLGVYLLETGERLSLLDSGGEPLGKSAQLTVTVETPEQPPSPSALTIPQPLEYEPIPQLRLLGYELGRTHLFSNPQNDGELLLF